MERVSFASLIITVTDETEGKKFLNKVGLFTLSRIKCVCGIQREGFFAKKFKEK